jgi:hypothetical protein
MALFGSIPRIIKVCQLSARLAAHPTGQQHFLNMRMKIRLRNGQIVRILYTMETLQLSNFQIQHNGFVHLYCHL